MTDFATERNQLRQLIRQRRQALTAAQQQQAASDLVAKFVTLAAYPRMQHLALYLSNDGELNTQPLINMLWEQVKSVYLPILHPFKAGFLIFQAYRPDTPMTQNKFGIAEPVLDVSQLIPLPELQLIGLPLVAFDQHANRMGMGGGFYDRTLQNVQFCRPAPLLVGLAHQCQQVPSVPTEAWDVPLQHIVTPAQIFSS